MAQDRQIPGVPKHLARWAERNPTYLPYEPRKAVAGDIETEEGPGPVPKLRHGYPSRVSTAETAVPQELRRRRLATSQQAVRSARRRPTALDRYKLSLRRYDPKHAGLPWEMLSACPTCDAVVPSTFFLHGDQVVLSIRCRRCGETLEAHHDVLFDTNARSRLPDSADRTYGGTRINPAVHELPRTVETLCPECACNILGRYYVKDGRVMIEKTCPRHGYFRDCINSDVGVYLRASYWTFEETPGLTNPHVADAAHCPSDCGLCNQHQSTAVLANIDLTNRCNLTCPVCFASANQAGYVHEPTFEQVERELMQLLDCRPIPCTSIQFSGGEPTLHPRWHDIVRRARELGMTNIQAATNGIAHANLEFAQQSKEAGLHSLYLQFDGLDDDIYRRVRGEALLERKLQAIENCRKTGMKVCLVPTVINGENDDQVAKIFDFAVENADVVSAISYQPVCFSGRISRRELDKKRYTLGHLAHAIANHTGAELERDFFPLSFMAPLSNILSAVEKKPKITCSCHSDCAFGTYFLVAPAEYPGQPSRERVVPMPKAFDIPALFTDMNELARKIAPKKRLSRLDKARIFWSARKTFNRDAAPPGLTPIKFVQAIQGCVSKQEGRTDRAQKENYRTLMCAGMHFQDRYNYDVERVKRCVIHYSTPDGIYPFCTYNSGPTYRPFIEAMWSVPYEAWAAAEPKTGVVLSGRSDSVLLRTGRANAAASTVEALP
ncbi:MAG: radical SAM protein [Phycisphaerae bacterium]|nr:radical SAM protein [Phycisphaerae bacterium]